MASRALAAFALLSLAGCGDPGLAPGATADGESPDLLFVVGNEVFGIRADGTMRRSFGTVGDDLQRAGYPRMLPDGRLSVIGDQEGRSFPYTTAGDRTFARIGSDGVALGDGACGAMVQGTPQLIFFATTLYLDGSIDCTAERATTDGRKLSAFGVVSQAGLFGPSPDGDDHVLAIHSPLSGDDEIWRIDVSGDQEALDHPEVVARLPFPKVGLSPSRMRDGRVVYVQFDLRDPDHIGELWVVEADGTMHGTGILGVDDAIAIGERVVIEASGGDRIADLLVTDLVHNAYNITNTPAYAEHLGWSTVDVGAR